MMIMPTQHLPNADRTPPSRKHTDFVAVEIHLSKQTSVYANHDDRCEYVTDNWTVALNPKPAKCLELKLETSRLDFFTHFNVLKCPL
jgi:hypothetical protein